MGGFGFCPDAPNRPTGPLKTTGIGEKVRTPDPRIRVRPLLFGSRVLCVGVVFRKAQTFWPICIFDWAEDHEIWRHMDGNHVRGLVRKTVVVRRGGADGEEKICCYQHRHRVRGLQIAFYLEVNGCPKTTCWKVLGPGM